MMKIETYWDNGWQIAVFAGWMVEYPISDLMVWWIESPSTYPITRTVIFSYN